MTLPDLVAAATPGPWYANVDDLVGGFQVANRDVPASALDTRQGSNDRAVALFISEVDARFVAFAPEMAALLIEARDYISDTPHHWRCEFRTAAKGWKPGDPPIVECNPVSCGRDDLLARIDGLTDRREG